MDKQQRSLKRKIRAMLCGGDGGHLYHSLQTSLGTQEPALGNPDLSQSRRAYFKGFHSPMVSVQDKGKRLRVDGLAGKPATCLGSSDIKTTQFFHAHTEKTNPTLLAYAGGVYAGK